MAPRSAPDDAASEQSLSAMTGQPRRDSFSAFYLREMPLQVRRATLLVGDRDTARDLVHDAFADVLVRYEQLRDPGPYLNTVILNKCRDHARATKRQHPLGRNPVADTDTRPEHEELWDALQALPFNHRAVLVLRFHHQMTDREIADTLGCRIGSVGPWIQRGLRRLGKDLQ